MKTGKPRLGLNGRTEKYRVGALSHYLPVIGCVQAHQHAVHAAQGQQQAKRESVTRLEKNSFVSEGAVKEWADTCADMYTYVWIGVGTCVCTRFKLIS